MAKVILEPQKGKLRVTSLIGTILSMTALQIRSKYCPIQTENMSPTPQNFLIHYKSLLEVGRVQQT